MTDRTVGFSGEVFQWEGEAGWHFVRLPADVADEVRELSGPRRGFGSVRVEARVGATTWRTSVFPDKESGSFVLPVKAQVRTAEQIRAGDEVRFELMVEPDAEGDS